MPPGADRGWARLSGEVVVSTVFASDVVASWTHDDKLQQWDRLLRCQEWLTDEAARWDKSLSFDNLVLGLEEDVMLDLLPRGDPAPRLLSRVAGALGYDSVSDMHATALHGKARASSGLVLVAGAGDGKARTLPKEAGLGGAPPLGGALVFDRVAGAAQKTRSLCAAILRAFGAVDLADPRDEARDLRNRARYAGDVMLGLEPLPNTIAGPVTAYLVGWTENHEPSFEDALPPGEWDARRRE
ncbi:MAG: hypothetical protein JNL38_14880 [Myxococcales bacterium]|nr:hypothetical protein [Myxococcales bacterium]